MRNMPKVEKYVITNKEGDIYYETDDGSTASHQKAMAVMHKMNDDIPATTWKDLPRISHIYIQYVFEKD